MWPTQSPKSQSPERASTSDEPTAGASAQSDRRSGPGSSRQDKPTSPRLWPGGGRGGLQGQSIDLAKDTAMSPLSEASDAFGAFSPGSADRVFPIRSVVSVDPTPTPSQRSDRGEGYFATPGHARRQSMASNTEGSKTSTPMGTRQSSIDPAFDTASRKSSGSRHREGSSSISNQPQRSGATRQPTLPSGDPSAEKSQNVASAVTGQSTVSPTGQLSESSGRPPSVRSGKSLLEETGGLVTARFKHVVYDGQHVVITGRDGGTLQRCEDEPIHIPGAVQGFGMLLALQEESDGKLVVRVVSENSKRMIGYTPKQLFALESFTDILSEDQADNMLDHIDFIRDDDADVATNGPEVFTMSIRSPQRKSRKMWCAMHISTTNPDLIICEFELEDDQENPLVPLNDQTPEPPEDTLQSEPTPEEYAESTQNTSRPLRVLRSARKRKGEAAAMEVFNIMSQVQEQLAAAPSLEVFLKVLVGVVKELTGFHRVMIYQFDQTFNGRVVTELVDPRATKDLYKGLNFPASDIPKQARDLYKINKVRLLYDRDQETARLVCRTVQDLENPIDLTYAYLRAMSPIHLKYLTNMAVRSSMSISINAFDELWGLIACHTYGSRGMRVAFPIRKMCRLIGDSASRNIERLSYASRLQARKLINTVPTQHNPSGYIIASSEDLLKLFDADFGLLSIRDETKILGVLEQSQEALAIREYMRMRKLTSVTSSQDIREDFPDLRYPPGFQVIAGLLLVPLSVGGSDFIVFFRKGQLKEVKWAGNPYEKFVKEGTEGYLEPRKSFKTWSETVVGKCREWTEEEVETAAVLCLVYGKFIEVWRQKEAALQNSQLTKLLLANSAHEVRTPLNAIINYLEIALEGSLDNETRENLAKSHSASKSLIYVINDLLDLTKTEEGVELIKGEVFDLRECLREATDMFRGDARRKQIAYEIVEAPDLPDSVIGDQRKIRQCITNVAANAVQYTSEGGVKVEMRVAARTEDHVDVELIVEDTGSGMSSKKLDSLFRDLEQVQSVEAEAMVEQSIMPDSKALPEAKGDDSNRTLGLGLAVVARIIRNMEGQMRLKSEEGKGSRFVLQLPFDLPDSDSRPSITSATSEATVTPPIATIESPLDNASSVGSSTPQPKLSASTQEVTLVRPSSRSRQSNPSSPAGVTSLSRKNSSDSVHSKKSLRSIKSQSSANSAKSDVDRLIEAIQEPAMVERGRRPSISGRSSASASSNIRPKLSHRSSQHGITRPISRHSKEGSSSMEMTAVLPEHLRELRAGPSSPGEKRVTDSKTPLRAVKMPEEGVTPWPREDPFSGERIEEVSEKTSTVGDVSDTESLRKGQRTAIPKAFDEYGNPTANHLNILVAEDDPVNSKIVKKRLEKLEHAISLTINGEDCASTYGDRCGTFDVILMDMQMPIVDGVTSTKMIRSFEKLTPSHELSARARLNGRIPIIAVSASLIEKDRQSYIDAGFDAWILKPISFPRLTELLQGIVSYEKRKENVYRDGWEWEKGGWFHEAEISPLEAETTPSGAPPTTSSKQLSAAAASDDPQGAGDDTKGRQPEEQHRLMEEQKQKRGSQGFFGGDSADDEDGNETWEESVESQPTPTK
ncbi:MAG: Light-sensor Protein kinase [Bogoriella megaspora]|nr:MAG: Light-sensor Protein kinase [Bogoriella megaspora]